MKIYGDIQNEHIKSNKNKNIKQNGLEKYIRDVPSM